MILKTVFALALSVAAFAAFAGFVRAAALPDMAALRDADGIGNPGSGTCVDLCLDTRCPERERAGQGPLATGPES